MSSRPAEMESNDSRAMKMANKDRVAANLKTIPENNNEDLIDILDKHRRSTLRKDSMVLSKHQKGSLSIGRDSYQRTTSMLSYLSGVEEDEIMTNTYKYVTTSVLWFCYFSLVCHTLLTLSFGYTTEQNLKESLSLEIANLLI